MMNLTIGNTTIAINSCTRMRDTKRGFYLDIKIPKDSISMDELSTLLDGNTETIFVIDDAENESAYNGFKMLSNLSLENGVYTVCQACTSEIEAQLSIAQNKVTEQAKALEDTNRVVAQQIETIVQQGNTIDRQSEIITAQAEQVMMLEETAVVQMSTIDSLLLDIIPAVIADAVTTAVADALASNSTAGEPVVE